MRKKHAETSKHIQSRPVPEPVIDYSPKTYTLQEQLFFGTKLISIAGIIVLLFWLIGKFV